MNRREFMRRSSGAALALAAGGLAAPSERSAAAAERKPPNIVLILADDLGYGHLGCYGQELIETPNLDRLAREGLRCTQAYAGAPLCAPSRSVLMTGLHAGHTAVRSNTGGVPLADGDVTFAEVLKQAGYRTGLFGKWGLGEATTEGVPNRQGFDEFFGYLHQRHAHYAYTDYLWHNEERHPLPGNRDGRREQYTHDVILEKGLEFIRANEDGPFLCFLSFTIPHHEWTVPEESLKAYAGRFEEDPPEFRWREGYAFPKQPRATVAAMISHLDRGIGRVVDLLEERGIRENTLMLFTSDNGPDRISLASADFFNANGPLRGYKGDLYEGGIRVPAIANWPGRIAPGRTVDRVWHFADILPTFAELAGAADRVPAGIDGLSFLPVLFGEEPAKRHEYLYWEVGEGEQALRKGDWKAVRPGADAPIELYDLSRDIEEAHDVAVEHPELVAELQALMQASHVDMRPQIEPGKPDGRNYF
jgi:arylsulfatase A